MPPEEILLVNPNTGTTPVFRSRRDAEITIGIYKRVPVLWRDDPEENPWGLSFMQRCSTWPATPLFRTSDRRRRPPALRGQDGPPLRPPPRHLRRPNRSPSQRRHASTPTPDQQDDPYFVVQPRYWVDRSRSGYAPGQTRLGQGLASRLARHRRSSDERTMICSVLPRVAIGHTFPLMLSTRRASAAYTPTSHRSSSTTWSAEDRRNAPDLRLRQAASGTPADRLRRRAGCDRSSSRASSNSPTPPGTWSRSPAT